MLDSMLLIYISPSVVDETPYSPDALRDELIKVLIYRALRVL